MQLGTTDCCCPVCTDSPRQAPSASVHTGYAVLCWPGHCLPQSPVNFTVLCYGLRIHS
ncbi:hypothetical protein I79_025577 [Cricetulus griseus]|uniref:Uncharacterized protein n=1 Tax=Cricetulus griseus TaxID=10029 RepID=G3INP6_CRIGR|nr:hypothetical protein I79_025577 [Cricetulus griseus]